MSAAVDVRSAVESRIRAEAEGIVGLSHRIHAHPELAFQESRAAAWVGEALEAAGFEVTRAYCELETAIHGRTGRGDLEIALVAEYDALPDVGHACGHNIIAAATVGAAVGLKPVAELLGITLRVVGTPAEENGGGKIELIERGGFAGISAAMMVHPAPFDLLTPKALGVDWIEVTYHGRAAHASASPEQGVNAADALVIAQVAIGLLRQHTSPMDRIHGIVTRAGEAPNIVPAKSQATYMVRSPEVEGLGALRKRVEACFEAGALGSGAALEIAPRRHPYAPMVHDERLTKFYKANAEKLGRQFMDAEEVGQRWAASTDMGNVSQVIPSLQPLIGISSLPATNHQPAFAAACVSAAADQAVIDGAIGLAWTVIDVAADPATRDSLLLGKTP